MTDKGSGDLSARIIERNWQKVKTAVPGQKAKTMKVP